MKGLLNTAMVVIASTLVLQLAPALTPMIPTMMGSV